MKKISYIGIPLALSIILFMSGCAGNGLNIENYRVKPRPDNGITEFQYTFDSSVTISDLFPDDLSGWTFLQLVEPFESNKITVEDQRAYTGENSIELQNITFYSGPNAVKLTAPPSGTSVSKAALQKGGFFFESGDDLWVSAWYYVQGFGNYEALFLLDIETTEFQGSPGRRLMMSGGDNELKLESKSGISGPEYRQNKENAVLFPKNSWVHIRVHLYLSEGAEGYTEIWQDGVKIIDQPGQNMPTANAVYDRFQFGITANSSPSKKEIYLDNIIISKQVIPE